MTIMLFRFLIWIFLLISLQCIDDPQLYLVKLNDSSALCLDGSPGAYYISKQGDPKKIYIQFQGGGWCEGPNNTSQIIQSCYFRSKTNLGSSINYPSQVIYPDGVLSINDKNNFKDWTKVLLKYCDGSGHQGTKLQPVQYNETKLYFRGYNITIAQLQRLEKQNKIFSAATNIIVGGSSAGGVAVLQWINYIKEKVKKGKVWDFRIVVFFQIRQIQKQNNLHLRKAL